MIPLALKINSMKNTATFFSSLAIFLFSCFNITAQETSKDTIKTEVVNVITSYTPTISDAFKIKKRPNVKLGERLQKKKLQYHIFSVPVASTFVPKKGDARELDFDLQQQFAQNFISAGIGTHARPNIEAFLHKNKGNNEFGFYTKFANTKGNLKNVLLSNDFSNFNLHGYYSQNNKNSIWKLAANYTRDSYNWYGLPNEINFLPATISAINEQQIYNGYDTQFSIQLKSSALKSIDAQFQHFSDTYKSKEIVFNINPTFEVPLRSLHKDLTDLTLKTSLHYLNGEYPQSYNSLVKNEYSFFTLGAVPNYFLSSNDLSIKLGTKLVYASDLENKINQFFIYPDINISYPLFSRAATIYVAIDGGLHTNTNKEFATANPFISPTQKMLQTNRMYSFKAGVKGKINDKTNVSFQVNYHNEEDKPLFAINNSKSDGITSTHLGFEYGNSFEVVYDDIKSLQFNGNLSVEIQNNLTLETNVTYNKYTLSTQEAAWNLPNFLTEITIDYSINKWTVSGELYFVGERKGKSFAGSNPSSVTVKNLSSYTDFNVYGGYTINSHFTAYLKMNNLFNAKYQSINNFPSFGTQILGGITYSFDF